MKTSAQLGTAGDEFVKRIREKVQSTFSPAVLTNNGLSHAMYNGKFPGKREPVLVSSVNSVGTKLKVAFLMEKHDTVGYDLVNRCVNDIAVCGAEPLFFLDYFATGKLVPSVAEHVVEGMIKGCKENNCSLIGGETAEMSGFYRENEYDIAGTIVGVADKKKIFDGKKIKAGDVLVGLPSTGLHTNGYTLARKVLFERYEVEDFVNELGMRLGDALLSVHRSYLKAIRAVAASSGVHAIAHITGGGIIGNTMKVVPKGHRLKIDWRKWERPAIFSLIQKCGNILEHEMERIFNLGIGLVIISTKGAADRVIRTLENIGEQPFVFGEVVKN